MEVTQEQMIDMTLNVAGYLLAGVLWIVVQSLFSNKKTNAVVQAASSNIENNSVSQVSVHKTEQRSAADNLQYISFDSKAVKAMNAHSDPGTTDRTAPTTTAGRDNSRRNRAEVLQMARRMRKAGATRETIQSNLPISEGELALLSSN